MDITNISQMYQTKLQEINSRIPTQTTINNKFSSYLETAKLKNNSTENIENSAQSSEETSSSLDTTQLLNSLLTYNSGPRRNQLTQMLEMVLFTSYCVPNIFTATKLAVSVLIVL